MTKTVDVAIAGLDGRFPGADSLDELWQSLLDGSSAIRAVDDQRWEPLDSESPRDRAGLMKDPSCFDASFFGISPAEAEAMDPQQRISLEVAWRAVEDAGVDPHTLAGRRVGVYVGVMGNEWGQITLTDPSSMTPQLGTGNGYCMIANRISYVLGVTGPSMAVDSACSSSLLALHSARRAIQAGDCDEAIVVGVNVIMTPAMHRFYAIAGIGAADGECKPFSREANGIVRGEAVVAAYLRPCPVDGSKKALPRMRAIIRGSAVDHDGRSNGLTSPNRQAQSQVITRALEDGGISAKSISAVECHGTGTILGDMIEANALGDVFSGKRDTPLYIGSVKGNIGHVEGAAGLAGVAKAVLSLEKNILPPSRHATKENPALRLHDKQIQLLKESTPLTDQQPRIGVSSFGLGGANAHVVLEAAPKPPHHDETNEPFVILLGAPDDESLRRNAAHITDYLQETSSSIRDVCASLRRTQSMGAHRVSVVAEERSSLIDALSNVAQGEPSPAVAWSSKRMDRGQFRSGWVFSGQGTEYAGMTKHLAETSPTYAARLDEICGHILPGLRDLMQGDDDAWTHEPLYAQAAVVAHELAMSFALKDMGHQPTWVAGHSLGEISAAVIAGVMDLKTAGALVRARGKACAAMNSHGGMLAVAMGDPSKYLMEFPDVELAVRNRKDRCVLSGAKESLRALSARLKEAGIHSVELDSTRAFHSSHVDPVLQDFAEAIDDLEFDSVTPKVPFYSSRFGRFLNADDRLDAAYWICHLREPVQFYKLPEVAPVSDLIVEITPRPVLASSIRTGRLSDTPVLTLGRESAGADDLYRVLARVMVETGEVGWSDERTSVEVPGYVFDTSKHYWRTASYAGQRQGKEGITASHEISSDTLSEISDDDLTQEPAFLKEWILTNVAKISGHPPEKVHLTSRLTEDLFFDSIMVVQLVSMADSEFGIEIDIRLLVDQAQTPQDLITYLLREHHGELRASMTR